MKFHSKVLNMGYDKLPDGGLEFEDGVKYNKKELRIISNVKLTSEQKRFFHKVKKIFDGEVVDIFEKQKKNTLNAIKSRNRID